MVPNEDWESFFDWIQFHSINSNLNFSRRMHKRIRPAHTWKHKDQDQENLLKKKEQIWKRCQTSYAALSLLIELGYPTLGCNGAGLVSLFLLYSFSFCFCSSVYQKKIWKRQEMRMNATISLETD